MPPIRELLRTTGTVLLDAALAWNRDHAPRKGAALAYYTVFSLAPILVIATAIAGTVFGEQAARGQLVGEIRGLIGVDGARAIEALLRSASAPGRGLTASIAGILTLLLGATTALIELKGGLDDIWGTPQPVRDRAWYYGIWDFVRARLLTLGLLLATGFLLLVSLVVSAVAAALTTHWDGMQTLGLALQIFNFIASLGLATLLFAAIYSILPSRRIPWRDVWFGAFVTALLFDIGKVLIGLYLGNGAIASTYGAVGAIVIVLVWVYYSAQIFLFGAEITKAYAYRHGSRCPAAAARTLRQPGARAAREPDSDIARSTTHGEAQDAGSHGEPS